MKVEATDDELKGAALRMALHAVRNTYLEDIHAEQRPITDIDMKKLMIEVVDRIYAMLKNPEMLVRCRLPDKNWHEPKIPFYWTEEGFKARGEEIDRLRGRREKH